MAEWKLNDQICLNPDQNEYGPEARRALSVWWPIGREPGRATVLLSKEAATALADKLDDEFSLTISEVTEPGRLIPNAQIKINGLRWLRGTRIGGGHPNGEGAYIVELADVRWFWGKWSYLDNSYNVPWPAPPAESGAGRYWSATLTGGAQYTWTQLLESIWNTLPGHPAFPALPIVPDGKPTGWRFRGVNAWDAFNEVLAKIHCAPVLNPATGAWSIVYLGATQTGLVDAEFEKRNLWIDHLDPIINRAALYPEKITVYFPRVAMQYGTEPEVIQSGGTAWDIDSVYGITTNTNRIGAVADTRAILWDDLPAYIKFDGTRDNQTDLDARAADRVARWLAAQDKGRIGRILYSGLITTILPGSQIKAVRWAQTSDGPGLTTETIRHDGTPAAAGGGDADCDWLPSVSEHLQPPDYARQTFPNWPRTLQAVKVYDGSSGEGVKIERTGNGLFKGRILRADPSLTFEASNDAWESQGDCWLCFINYQKGGSYDADFKAVNGRKYLGKLNGTATIDGTTRPVYLVFGEPANLGVRRAKVGASAITAGGSGDVTIQGGPMDGNTVTANDWLLKTGEQFEPDTKLFIAWNDDLDQFDIIQAECPDPTPPV